jgi:hypothetical protein
MNSNETEKDKRIKKTHRLFGKIKKKTYLCIRKKGISALLAQLVEQLTLNQWV